MMMAFGFPVLPEVKMMKAGSLGFTGGGVKANFATNFSKGLCIDSDGTVIIVTGEETEFSITSLLAADVTITVGCISCSMA